MILSVFENQHALADHDSPERDFFFFDEDLLHGYESWYGVRSLPKLNWGSPELRERMLNVARRWLEPPYAPRRNRGLDDNHDGGLPPEIQQEIQRDGSPQQAAAYEQAAPVEQLFAGYERYWSKKAE